MTIEKRQNQMAVFMLPAPIPSGGGGDELHWDHKYRKATKYIKVQKAARGRRWLSSDSSCPS